jgi:hypothetical protein
MSRSLPVAWHQRHPGSIATPHGRTMAARAIQAAVGRGGSNIVAFPIHRARLPAFDPAGIDDILGIEVASRRPQAPA